MDRILDPAYFATVTWSLRRGYATLPRGATRSSSARAAGDMREPPRRIDVATARNRTRVQSTATESPA